METPSVVEEASEVVLVDHVSVAPDEALRFAELWAEEITRMRRQPGFVKAQLRPLPDAGAGGYISIVVWQSSEPLPASLQRDSEAVQRAGIQRFGAVKVDRRAREVRKHDVPVPLTLKEFELLLTLMSHPGRVFTRDELMDRVWGYRAVLETGTLSVHMRRLRKKLENDPADPRHLQTVWGVGYRFEP